MPVSVCGSVHHFEINQPLLGGSPSKFVGTFMVPRIGFLINEEIDIRIMTFFVLILKILTVIQRMFTKLMPPQRMKPSNLW